QTGQRVALIGPLADNRVDLLGTWAILGQAADVETVREGFQTYLAADQLTYAPGCALAGEEPPDFAAALAAAAGADVVVLVLGEGAELSGESHSRAHLGLPGRQLALVEALAATGKPLVAVLMCGRPLVVPELVNRVEALLVAWHGGVRAGQAVADLLFGAANPSGKLTASWPRAEGQIPVYYAHKTTGRPAAGAGTTQYHEPFRSTYLDEPNAPLFVFGQGQSYTQFEYRRLDVLTPRLTSLGTLRVTATIRNTGARAGTEVVQLYVRDKVGSVTRPVKELKGFQRLTLEPGEERQVDLTVPVTTLGFHGLDRQYQVEAGEFEVWVGPDCAHGLSGVFEVLA
ncbi:MAG: glycoside hydrolase family 3 C-terminal domain-containing protein, partial [Anaerolineales bacterium]|nr:glycoside hydrolase family 3 C-terminal domain-containing protein [Anaerolineales bacterium]